MITGLYSALNAVLANKVFPNHVPAPTTLPYVTYRITDVEPGRHLKGSDGLNRTTVEVKIFAATYASCTSTRDTIFGAIGADGFRGTWGGKTVQLAHWDNDADEYEPPGDGSDSGQHERTMSLIVWHAP